MLCSRCVLPFLAFYLLLEEISAFILPNRFRQKRDMSWLDQEFVPRLPDRLEQGDFSLGDADEITKDVESRHSQSATFLTPLEHLSVNRQNHHRQHHRKNNDKWRKVAPLDSIGSSLMSSHRNRKDEPDDYWEDYSE
ncbi:uncharacterized protein ACJ7VT_012685 [Polymixia lowei]